MDINQIDWNSIWREGVIFFIGRADKAVLWDRNASRWNLTQTQDDYGEKVIERLKLRSDWTILDVGCGAGILAIPLAKMCKHVTALDASSEMLRHLEHNAAQQGVSNITCMHKLIENTIIGKDIDKHDVVIASRSMGLEHDLRSFLMAMDNATKRYAYVVWGADERTFDLGMWRAIGRPYGETRTYVVLYNLLHQMGIRANIELFECQQTAMSYQSVDDALSELRQRFVRMNMNRELTHEEEGKLGKYLRETIKETADGTFRYVNSNRAMNALIWWKKE
jgi:precorrin-6B methylase 2